MPSFNFGLPQRNDPYNPFAIQQPRRKNIFGYDEPLPTAPVETTPSQPTGVNPTIPPAFDFAGEYAKVNANRPNKMAYQQAVNEGAPTINRGKWAKLGAVLAASAEGLATRDASKGYNLGMSAYQAPQMRSDEAYEKKMRGLGNMANLEESEVSNNLRALETRNRNTFDERTTKIAEEDLGLRTREQANRDKSTNAEINALAKQSMSYLEKEDGHTYLVDKNNPSMQIDMGITRETTKEQRQKMFDDYVKREEVRGYYADQLQRLQGEQQLKNTMAGTAGRAGNKVDPVAPDKVIQYVTNDISGAIGRKELPPDASEYLTVDDNGVIQAQTPWLGDEATTNKVRAFIGGSVARANAGGAGGSSSSSSSGGAGGGSGSVQMLTPKGKPFTAQANEVEDLIAGGATVANPGGGDSSKFVPYGSSEFGSKPGVPNAPPTESDVEPGAAAKFAGGLMPGNVTESISGVNYNNPLAKFSDIGPEVGSNLAYRKPEAMPGTFTGIAPNRVGAYTAPRDAQGITTKQPQPMKWGATQAAPPPMPPRMLQPGQRAGFLGPAPSLNPKDIPPSVTLPKPASGPRGDIRLPSPPPVPNAMPPAPLAGLPGGNTNLIPPPNVAMSNVNVPPQVPQMGPSASLTPPRSVAMPNVNPAPLAGLPTGNAPMSPPPPVNPIKLTPPARMISPAGANIGTPPPATPQLLTEKLARVSKRIQSETGYTIRPNTKTRTPEEQAKLYAQGRTAPGKVVTNADGTKKKSEHQEGLAADLSVFDKNGKKVDSKKVWDMIGKIAEEEGLTWGGRWKSPYDPGHVQLNPVK